MRDALQPLGRRQGQRLGTESRKAWRARRDLGQARAQGPERRSRAPGPTAGWARGAKEGPSQIPGYSSALPGQGMLSSHTGHDQGAPTSGLGFLSVLPPARSPALRMTLPSADLSPTRLHRKELRVSLSCTRCPLHSRLQDVLLLLLGRPWEGPLPPCETQLQYPSL